MKFLLKYQRHVGVSGVHCFLMMAPEGAAHSIARQLLLARICHKFCLKGGLWQQKTLLTQVRQWTSALSMV